MKAGSLSSLCGDVSLPLALPSDHAAFTECCDCAPTSQTVDVCSLSSLAGCLLSSTLWRFRFGGPSSPSAPGGSDQWSGHAGLFKLWLISASTLTHTSCCGCCWLNIPATCKAYLTEGSTRKCYLLHTEIQSYRSNILSHTATVYWHQTSWC